MSTLSIPISSQLEEFIESQIKNGNAANKADVVRKALRKMEENEAISAILTAQQEIRDGKGIRGDLREILKRLP